MHRLYTLKGQALLDFVATISTFELLELSKRPDADIIVNDPRMWRERVKAFGAEVLADFDKCFVREVPPGSPQQTPAQFYAMHFDQTHALFDTLCDFISEHAFTLSKFFHAHTAFGQFKTWRDLPIHQKHTLLEQYTLWFKTIMPLFLGGETKSLMDMVQDDAYLGLVQTLLRENMSNTRIDNMLTEAADYGQAAIVKALLKHQPSMAVVQAAFNKKVFTLGTSQSGNQSQHTKQLLAYYILNHRAATDDVSTVINDAYVAPDRNHYPFLQYLLQHHDAAALQEAIAIDKLGHPTTALSAFLRSNKMMLAVINNHIISTRTVTAILGVAEENKIDLMPPEVILLIIAYLDGFSALAFSQVNQKIRGTFAQNPAWETRIKQDFGPQSLLVAKASPAVYWARTRIERDFGEAALERYDALSTKPSYHAYWLQCFEEARQLCTELLEIGQGNQVLRQFQDLGRPYQLKHAAIFCAHVMKNFNQFKNNKKHSFPAGTVPKTPLMIAASYGLALSVRLLLKQRDVKVNQVNRDGYTALHYACMQGPASVAQDLLAAGANVTIGCTSMYRFTATHFAAQTDNVPLLQSLHRYGADITQTTSHGFTPMMVAAQNCAWKAAAYLLAEHVKRPYPRGIDDGINAVKAAWQQAHIIPLRLIYQILLHGESVNWPRIVHGLASALQPSTQPPFTQAWLFGKLASEVADQPVDIQIAFLEKMLETNKEGKPAHALSAFFLSWHSCSNITTHLEELRAQSTARRYTPMLDYGNSKAASAASASTFASQSNNNRPDALFPG